VFVILVLLSVLASWLNHIATTVLATGFLPEELLVCGSPCQQV